METGKAYTATGNELKAHFSGNQTFESSFATTTVDGKTVDLSAILLTDAAGGGYNYFKLRDLGAKLGFTADFVNGQITVTSK